MEKIISLVQNYKHNNKERLCYNCNKLMESKDDITIVTIQGRGYGSKHFDGDHYEIQLCPHCLTIEVIKWINEKPTYENRKVEQYQYENNLKQFIDNFCIENQEYIYNQQNSSMRFDREEWILLEHEMVTQKIIDKYGCYIGIDDETLERYLINWKNYVNYLSNCI